MSLNNSKVERFFFSHINHCECLRCGKKIPKAEASTFALVLLRKGMKRGRNPGGLQVCPDYCPECRPGRKVISK